MSMIFMKMSENDLWDYNDTSAAQYKFEGCIPNYLLAIALAISSTLIPSK